MGVQSDEGISGPNIEQGGPTADWGTAGTSCYHRIHPGPQACCHAGAESPAAQTSQGLQGCKWRSWPEHQEERRKMGTHRRGNSSYFWPLNLFLSFRLPTTHNTALSETWSGSSGSWPRGSQDSDSRTKSLLKKCFREHHLVSETKSPQLNTPLPAQHLFPWQCQIWASESNNMEGKAHLSLKLMFLRDE